MAEDFNSWKDKLKESSDIVTVISKYVSLQRKGTRWWGNCPFHFEKTPSFAVYDVEQFYKCYGCGAFGDVFSFVEKMEAVDFMEACEILAKDANMKMPVFRDNENINKLKQQKEIAFNILRDTAKYYVNNLTSPQSKLAQQYIAKRQLDMQIVKDFGVGYSLGWDDLVKHLSSKGYNVSDMKMAGVVEEKEGKLFDAYAKRLIFPIINSNNDVIGFSARLLEDADFAKYKNTAQTLVFDKSRVLYGINNVKKFRQTEPLNEIIIVEGQMDLISIYKNGIKNAVATMGTALTQYHAKELKRYCNKVVLCFDGDSAGKKAAERSVEILNAAGLEVYVASLPNKSDPDDYVKENGKEKFMQLIADAKYWIDYLILELKTQFNLDVRNEKNEFISSALKIVKKVEQVSSQMVYLDLIKNITNISVDVLKRDLENINTSSPREKIKDESIEQIVNKENSYVKAMKFVISSLLHKKEYAKLDDSIKQNMLNGDYVRIYDYIKTSYENNKKPIVSALFDMFDVENNPDIKAIVNYEFALGNDGLEYYTDCVKTIKQTGLLNQQQLLTAKMSQEKTIEGKKEIAQQLNEILKQLRNL